MVVGVTFDVFGTLFDWRSSLLGVVERVLEGVGAGVNAREFLDYWRNRQLIYTHVDTMLERGRTPFIEITRNALLHTLRRYNITFSDEDIKALVDKWRDLEPFPEVRYVVRRIKENGYKIAPLSNGDRDIISMLVKKLDVEFDDIFSSEDVGAYKPNPRIYAQASERWGLGKEEIMHVAGSPIDAVGSKSYGYVTTWVNRLGIPHEEFPYKPDYVVKDFNGLLEILKIK